MYVYIHSETSPDGKWLYTVGHYRPDGKWIAESDHDSEEKAAERVHYLNGGRSEALTGRSSVARADEPAFPLPLDEIPPTVNGMGLTIREWFAGQALVGLLAFPHAGVDGQFAPEDAALEALAMADAMLAQSEKK